MIPNVVHYVVIFASYTFYHLVSTLLMYILFSASTFFHHVHDVHLAVPTFITSSSGHVHLVHEVTNVVYGLKSVQFVQPSVSKGCNDWFEIKDFTNDFTIFTIKDCTRCKKVIHAKSLVQSFAWFDQLCLCILH